MIATTAIKHLDNRCPYDREEHKNLSNPANPLILLKHGFF